ncbi:hypothetical protein [Lachnoclostridium sp. MSJ-17]|uniref:hypothetical protein n=1 Tax=Lachnoclostridium sp. MSJ-17 TaxID=2841516 RepID=UPI001C0FCF14|nr:hypothetical protein [Lachnoclostridium sp. MSJ-17]MBU5462373.1 hypothetical protein [Lachnoclostridium sp. MSJ-17]
MAKTKLNKTGINFINDLKTNTNYSKAERLQDVLQFDSAVFFRCVVTDDVSESNNPTKIIDTVCFFVSVNCKDNYIIINDRSKNEVCKIYQNNVHDIFVCDNSPLNDYEVYFLFNGLLFTLLFQDVAES